MINGIEKKEKGKNAEEQRTLSNHRRGGRDLVRENSAGIRLRAFASEVSPVEELRKMFSLTKSLPPQLHYLRHAALSELDEICVAARGLLEKTLYPIFIAPLHLTALCNL